jgi:uncharacterized protein (TIGR02611 family)
VAQGWRRLQERLHANPVTGLLTKAVVTVLGVGVILAGVVMMVAPGPGVVAILAGLAILGTEYHWARRLLRGLRVRAARAADRARAVDPAVRRRRIGQAVATIVAVVGGVAAYAWLAGWPTWAVRGWNWVQGLSGLVPELPGM